MPEHLRQPVLHSAPVQAFNDMKNLQTPRSIRLLRALCIPRLRPCFRIQAFPEVFAIVKNYVGTHVSCSRACAANIMEPGTK